MIPKKENSGRDEGRNRIEVCVLGKGDREWWVRGGKDRTRFTGKTG